MSAWSQLEQLLTCAICLDRFRNPKLLPCQHTFCGEPCMEGLVDYARRQIKCPECRAEHRIPYNGVQSFPNNVTLSRFLDLHRGITGEEPEPLPSQMDRCGVCGEKSVCVRCAHCDKKVCDECRTAHLDILRREINRINTQIRRGLGKLTEHAQQAGKGSERLLLVSTQIRDEISEAVRRFVKDLKDREAKLLADLDEFTESEAKNSEKLTDDLDVELKTISSNCELVEQHMTEMDDWSDVELMEYKEIFLKTLDFLRNMDSDLLDFSRKIKYIQKVDLDNLRRNTADFGEIKITPPLSSFLPGGGVGGGALSPSDSSSNLAVPGSNLMRSQSDHRLAAQFANSRSKDPIQRSYLDVTGQSRYGGGINSDSERERGSSPPGRRGERFGSVRSYGSRTDNFGYTRGWERPGDSDYEPSNSSNFRSRFMRERIRERGGGGGDDHSFEDHDSDVGSNHRVRFQEEASQPRSKLFDTEEMANLRAPLSGIIKLSDSPHVMERLHQNEAKAKQKVAESKENDSSNGSSTMMSTPAPAPILPSRPSRQISEDEIEKQKKQNQAAAAATTAAATATSSPNQTSTQQSSGNNTTLPQTVSNKSNSNSRSSSLAAAENQQTTCNTTSSSANVPANRRVQALQKEDTRSVRSANSDDGATSSPESGDVTCDDETVSVANSTATNPAASALLNTANRRRIFASNGSSGTNASSQQSASVDFGAASPETAGIGRSNVSSSSSRTNQLQTANASPNRQVSSSSTSSSSPTSTVSTKTATPSLITTTTKTTTTTTTTNSSSNNIHTGDDNFSPNSSSNINNKAKKFKIKDTNNNYTDDHKSSRGVRSPLSPTLIPFASNSSTAISTTKVSNPYIPQSTYGLDSSSSYVSPSSRDFASGNKPFSASSSSSNYGGSKYASNNNSFVGSGSGGGGGGGGSAINDYLLGTSGITSDLLNESSAHHWAPSSSSFDPSAYDSTTPHYSSRINSLSALNNGTSIDINKSFNALTSPTSRHLPAYTSGSNFSGNHSSSGFGSASSFAANLAQLPQPSTVTSNSLSSWRDHYAPLNNTTTTGNYSTPSSAGGNGVAFSHSAMNNLHEPISSNHYLSSSSSTLPTVTSGTGIGSSTPSNQSTEPVSVNVTDHSCLAAAAVSSDICQHSVGESGVPGECHDVAAASLDHSLLIADKTGAHIDHTAIADTLPTRVQSLHDNRDESRKLSTANSETSSRKRTIRIKLATNENNIPVASTSAGIFSSRDFKGQERPNYNPYRQARNSNNSGSMFTGFSSINTSRNGNGGNSGGGSASRYRPNYSITQSSGSSLNNYRDSNTSQKTSFSLPKNGSFRSTIETSTPNSSLLLNSSSNSNLSGHSSICDSYTISRSSSGSNSSNYRHTVSTMTLPSSSNASIRVFSRSRFESIYIATSAAVAEFTDLIADALFWLCELALIITLLGLSFTVVTLPDLLSYKYHQTHKSKMSSDNWFLTDNEPRSNCAQASASVCYAESCNDDGVDDDDNNDDGVYDDGNWTSSLEK